MMNNQWGGFGQLNLAGVEEEKGSSSLPAGAFLCKIAEAKCEPTANQQGMKLIVKLDEVGGKGTVRDFINISNPNPKATEIGLKRLKHLLTKARHANPNQPGSVESMVGLTVGVHVVEGDQWRDNQGQMRRGGGEPRRIAPYFDTDEGVELGPVATPVPAQPQSAPAPGNGNNVPGGFKPPF